MSEINYEGIVLDVEEGERGKVVIWPDGRQAYDAKITLSDVGIAMLRQGYLCAHCLQDLRPVGAFPEQCPCCGFHVRELQVQRLHRDYVGEEELGSRLSLSDELTKLGEMWIPEDGI